YLVVPYFQRRVAVPAVIVTVFALTLIGISVFFALFSITLTSQADNIFNEQVNTVRGFNKQIADIDDVVTSTFASYITNLDQNHDRACRGRDETSIAKCGPIANGYSSKANAAREAFGAELGTRGAYAALGDGQSIPDRLTTVRSNALKLAQ